MKTITARIDDRTAREMDKLAQGTSRSEVIRKAIRHYIAARRTAQRRSEVEEYMHDSHEQELMRQMAEADMDDAETLLRRAEAA